ncbi:MAG: 3-keto-5-aminohexanoate cleavage protein [Candidatus Aminicenantes bacterium]|nr:3-keto-5-aminohexanoate cleavage protein [Candidatus Aminicenantes bacterium]
MTANMSASPALNSLCFVLPHKHLVICIEGKKNIVLNNLSGLCLLANSFFLFTFPHRDEIIKSNADETHKIASEVRELGREIATPKEARQIMGIA